MSVDYSSRLSAYSNKGVCGIPEKHDDVTSVEEKVSLLSEWMKSSGHTVVHTGAGISTSAGIPDFRGPNGVWTLEKEGRTVKTDVTFQDAVPTFTHYALVGLVQSGFVKYVVSQNVDGLHLRSGLPRDNLSELHGNMFMEKCDKCGKEYIRDEVVPTIGLKYTGNKCSHGGSRGRCRGKLRDTVLDWEDELPAVDMRKAEINSAKCDLSICLGSSLQIVPAATLPLKAKKNGGRIVICNLQPTKYDKQADVVIHYRVDEIMTQLVKKLEISLPSPPPPLLLPTFTNEHITSLT